MSAERVGADRPGIEDAVEQLKEAAAAKKCWSCGCLHQSLDAIERAYSAEHQPAPLAAVLRSARERLVDVRYDCLGCQICYPALAVNALNRAGGDHLVDFSTCPSDQVEARQGWPPLPGAYTVLRYQAPVAICTLTDDQLMTTVASEASQEASLVGTLQTENLGIERLITNVLANPNIRFLVVCGPDSRQAIGHLPGQSLVALSRWGLDDRSRIIGAKGRRPVIRNVPREAVEHFRRTVEVVDLVGTIDPPAILEAARSCAGRSPGPAASCSEERTVATLPGYLPKRMVSDPAGYFVVYVDRRRHLLSLEHYRNDGVLDVVVEGRVAAELYIPAIEKGLVSRLDHAAYLGRELARAQRALLSGERYVQDAAPELLEPSEPGRDCGCASACKEKDS